MQHRVAHWQLNSVGYERLPDPALSDRRGTPAREMREAGTLRQGDGFPFALIANLRAFGTADVDPHPSGGDNDESRAVFRCWLRRRRVDFDPPYREATSARWRAEAEESYRGEGVDRDREGACREQPARIDWRKEE
jgi:hypothetical protein